MNNETVQSKEKKAGPARPDPEALARATVPTALEIAEQKTKLDPQPLTRSVLDAIHSDAPGRHPMPRETLGFDGLAIRVTPETARAIAWSSDETLCPPEVFQKLLDLEAKMKAILEKAKAYSLTKVDAEVHSQRDRLHKALESGADPTEVQSREGIALRFRQTQSGLVNLLIKTTHQEVVPLARPVLERFEKAVEAFLLYTETGDRSACAGFDITYIPGPIWRAACVIGWQYTVKQRLPLAHAWALPSSILAGLVDFTDGGAL